MRTPPDIGLYIHLPWCVQKCPYCDFNSHSLKTELPETAYTDALIADMHFTAESVSDRQISSIFFGGGTPSLFSGNAMSRILDSAHETFNVSPDAEITLEANPGTADAENFSRYHQAGVNRISLGFQSLNNSHLAVLGRIHRAEESLKAYAMARNAGFDNINIDLMYGLPEQSPEQALKDLGGVIELDPQHISWYQLTLEPNTAFAHSPPSLPNHDHCYEIQLSGQALLARHGFKQYEVSAYARESYQCQHNLNYWRFGDYIGIGAGAHGKLTSADSILRTMRRKHPRDYSDTAGTDHNMDIKHISGDDVLFEFLLNRLRLTEHFDLAELEAATDTPRETFLHKAQSALEKELLIVDRESCRLSASGHQYLNEILLDFLPQN